MGKRRYKEYKRDSDWESCGCLFYAVIYFVIGISFIFQGDLSFIEYIGAIVCLLPIIILLYFIVTSHYKDSQIIKYLGNIFGKYRNEKIDNHRINSLDANKIHCDSHSIVQLQDDNSSQFIGNANTSESKTINKLSSNQVKEQNIYTTTEPAHTPNKYYQMTISDRPTSQLAQKVVKSTVDKNAEVQASDKKVCSLCKWSNKKEAKYCSSCGHCFIETIQDGLNPQTSISHKPESKHATDNEKDILERCQHLIDDFSKNNARTIKDDTKKMSISCASCGIALIIPVASRNKSIRCPNCKSVFKIDSNDDESPKKTQGEIRNKNIDGYLGGQQPRKDIAYTKKVSDTIVADEAPESFIEGNEFVYFIQNKQTKSVKIGYAQNPYIRKDQLQTGNEHELILLGCIRGNMDTESKLHSLFSGYRLLGEWFAMNHELEKAIKGLVLFLPSKE